MEKCGYTRKRKIGSRFLLTIFMVSTGFSTFSSTAWSDNARPPQPTNNYQQLMEAHKKSEDSIYDLSKKAFEENVKAQLEIRGFDINQFNENSFDDNQEIKLIIQLKKDAAIEHLAAPTGSKSSVQSIDQAADSVIESQKTIKNKIESLTGNKSNRSFGYLINGFSINAKYKDVDTIKAMTGVESVSAAKVYYPTSIDANQLANVQQVWEQHQFKGEGMVVAIIDSGIDPTHKDLRLSDDTKEKISLDAGDGSAKNIGYGKFFTRKVPFGHNYADNNEDIVDTNPGTGMHGMHVAGIVAANGVGDDPAKAVLGVAPEAQVLAMKVFPNNTHVATALDDDVISAIEDSVKLGADVLNMSLGSVSGTVDPNSPEQLVIKQAAEAGVLSVISAGNSSISTTDNTSVDPQNKLGTLDTGTLGSPGVTIEALTVASAENTHITSEGLLVQLVDTDGTKYPHKMETSTSPSGAIVFSNKTTADTSILSQPTDLIEVGIGAERDYEGKDVKDKIVLIQRGANTFSDKQRIAKEHEAKAAFIYDNTPDSPPIGMTLDDLNFLTLSLTKEDGDALVALAKQSTAQQFSFDINSYQFANPKTGKMSDFSSWGLTPDLEFKPEISAPGGNIYSTVNNNSYQTMSGTSMSSPFVAGSQALVYQALKNKKTNLSGIELTQFAKLSVMNTALPMLDKYHDDIIISPRRQGAGQIKVDKAVENTTSLTDSTDGDGALALKQINQNTVISVTLQNNGSKVATYQFTDFGGVYTEAQTSTAEVYETKINGAKLKASQKNVSLKPGETQTLELQLNLPSSFEKQQFVEGYIGFTSDTQPNLTMPFVGFYGDYSLAPVIDAPIYDQASIQGFGYFTDKNNTLLGLKNNTINPELVAISPNKDGRKDEAKPTFNFLRNAKNVTYEIVDADKKVLRRLTEEKQIRKDTFNPRAGRFSSHTITDANWDGTIYNVKTGNNEVVPDGQYQLKVVAKADIAEAKPQEMYLPIKVDTTKPTIENFTFDDTLTTPGLKVNLNDQLSGVDLRTVTVSINGKIETYDLSNQEADIVSIPLNDLQKPKVGQNQVEVIVSDYAGNSTYQNHYLQYGKDAGLVLFNLSDNQVITSNTASFLDADQTFTVQGAYPQDLVVNGIKATTTEGFFEVAVPITNTTKSLIFSNDLEGKSVIQEVPITVSTQRPPLLIINPDQASSTTNQTTVTLFGTTGNTTKKLELEQSSNSAKTDLTSLINSDGSFQTTVQLVHGQNLITLRATDEYGNQTVEKRLLTTTGYQQTDILSLENINVNGITSVGIGNPNYDSVTGIYTIKGRLREKVEHFTINQQEVDYDPITLAFNFPIELKQGKHSVAFYLQSSNENDGKPLINEGYYVIIDTILPTLQLDQLTVDENGIYSVYTNENPFHLKGLISDNFSGYKLVVNNENIHTDINYDTFDEKFFEGKPAADFDYEVPVTDGENHLQVGLTDSMGNTASKSITVFYKNEVLKAPTVTPSTKDLTNQAVTLIATANEEENIFYSYDGEHYEPYTKELAIAINQKIFFYASDCYGNKSDITVYEVTTIQTEIASKPVITVSSKTRELSFISPVFVTIGYEKELTQEQQYFTHLRYSLDQGKTYHDYINPFEQKTATEVWAQSYDDAGNESEIVKTAITFTDQDKPKDLNDLSKPEQPSIEKPNDAQQPAPVENLVDTVGKESTVSLKSALLSDLTPYRTINNIIKTTSLPQTGENNKNSPFLIGVIFIFVAFGYYVKRKVTE